ncbi:MAG: OmpA family protein [Methyloligellaceae bacterium]
MHFCGDKLRKLNKKLKLVRADSIFRVSERQFEIRASLWMGALCLIVSLLNIENATADTQRVAEESYIKAFWGNDSLAGDKHRPRLVQNAKSSKERDDWTSWPQWEGLPSDGFADHKPGAVTDETIDQVAQEIYDRAYTQFLVGDLRAAEQGFVRVINHYSQSSVAYKARLALAKVYSRKNIKNGLDKNLAGNTSFNILGSSIQQLSIISLSEDFESKAEIKPTEKTVSSLAINTSSNGSKDDFLLNVGDRVFFSKRSASLTREAEKLLQAQADWLKANKNYKLLIEGHADEEGPDHYNMVLSANRALSVQQFFLSREIDPGRIKTRHFGKRKPVAICKKESCSVQNRRAVTKLIPQSEK